VQPLAKAAPVISAAGVLPGGCVYELKWHGFRLVVVTTPTGSRLWTRQGSDLTDRFPEITAAATASLPVGSVVDGELVVFDGTRLSFSLLQQRMTRRPIEVARLAAVHPASFVAFDLLAADGRDLWAHRARAGGCVGAATAVVPHDHRPRGGACVGAGLLPRRARRGDGQGRRRPFQPRGPGTGGRSRAATPTRSWWGPSPAPWPAR
jgi:hypothetical protein